LQPFSLRHNIPKVRGFYILRRWLQILLYAFIGSILTAYTGPRLSAWTEIRLERLTDNNFAAFTIFAALLLFGALAAIHTFAKFELRQARWITYPPLPVSVIVALVTAPLWPSFGSFGKAIVREDTHACFAAAAFYLLFWLAHASVISGVAALKLRLGSHESHEPEGEPPKSLDELSDEGLATWFRREQPISVPSEDLFGFWDFTDRVVRKLEIAGNTIAIQGGFGSGKTSFIHLLEKRAKLRRRRMYFIRVSCWGFEETIAAQKSLLSSLVRRVNAEVDCLSIRTLPKEYVSLVSKKLEWLNILTPIDESPVEQLQRVSPILNSTAAQVIVVVEDVDRTGQKFDVSTVFALLAQFREVECLSFILTISPHQSVDFAKLCEFTEILPAPPPRTVALICHRIREHLIQKFPDDILVDKLTDLLEAADRNELVTLFAPGVKYWNSALAELLRPPRFLKRTLRRVSDAWEILHGEVSIDALLMTCALREAAPAAFSFLQAELDDILIAAQRELPKFGTNEKYYDKLRADLKTRWQVVVGRKEFDSRPVEVIILNLFPGTSFLSDIQTDVKTLKQGPSGNRAKVYAMRLFTERVEVAQ